MTEIALHEPAPGALALKADQHQWTTEQRAALAQIGVDRASPGDLAVFLHVAQRTGLDPFSRQLYLIGRGGKWTIQTGIDGLRVIAARHPEYGGQVGPQWCGEDGQWREFWVGRTAPVAARVGVIRRDWVEPVWGVALFSEFNGGNQMWRDKPAHMLAKVSEALALRKAFPHDLSGLVTDDEMGRADGRPGRAPQQAAPVTADELTGTPAAPARDWTGEITAAVEAGDAEALRDLYRQAKGHDDVRARITEAVKALPQPATEVHEAEVVDDDRADEYASLMADEQTPS